MNSSQFNPKEFASYRLTDNVDSFELPDYSKLNVDNVDMANEQSKDEELMKIKNLIINGNATDNIRNHHLIIDNVLYYLSDIGADAFEKYP